VCALRSLCAIANWLIPICGGTLRFGLVPIQLFAATCLEPYGRAQDRSNIFRPHLAWAVWHAAGSNSSQSSCLWGVADELERAAGWNGPRRWQNGLIHSLNKLERRWSQAEGAARCPCVCENG
jgi:hypothetical protein